MFTFISYKTIFKAECLPVSPSWLICTVCILAFCVQAKCSQHATLCAHVWVKERETGRPFQNGSMYSWSALKIREPWPFPSFTANYHLASTQKYLYTHSGTKTGIHTRTHPHTHGNRGSKCNRQREEIWLPPTLQNISYTPTSWPVKCSHRAIINT